MILSKIANSFESHSNLPQNQATLRPSMLKTAIYTTYFVSEVEQFHWWVPVAGRNTSFHSNHVLYSMIYTASSECEIFRNLHATKMARVGKIWDLGLDLMPIS